MAAALCRELPFVESSAHDKDPIYRAPFFTERPSRQNDQIRRALLFAEFLAHDKSFLCWQPFFAERRPRQMSCSSRARVFALSKHNGSRQKASFPVVYTVQVKSWKWTCKWYHATNNMLAMLNGKLIYIHVWAPLPLYRICVVVPSNWRAKKKNSSLTDATCNALAWGLVYFHPKT